MLTLLFFVLVGLFTTFALKTTGFPNPEIGVSLVQTTYPGASSSIINEQVTIPLEGAIKNVEGVKRFNSTTLNSFSNISVQFNEGINLDIARSKLDNAIKSVNLPDEVESPKLVTPQIGGSDIILAISGNDLGGIYETKLEVLKKLNSINSISKVEELVDLEKQVVIEMDYNKISQNGLTPEIIKSKIQSFNETIPVASNVEIDKKNASIVTNLKNNTLEDLKDLVFSTAQSGQIRLDSLAKIDIQYNYKKPTGSVYALRKVDGENIALNSVILNINSVKNTDQNNLITEIDKSFEDLKKIGDIDILKSNTSDVNKNFDANKVNIVTTFTQADDNNEQINEVIAGLIGGEIKELGLLSFLGYLFGGIWLVMFVMILVVSWRAAIISALAIPLSFIFSTIFLYVTGESLNTLTLFSLVLVTGLVVDPTLVVLEAIQRKLDTGLKGTKAVLEAIDNVGMGIFLAMVTNIIVFAPFGVLSGVFGQIFRYIPYTIVPAVIGSYVVPIVALSWFGSKFLKKNKNTKNTEEENLWPLAKWLIKTNTQILNLNRYIRFLIITFFLILPLIISIFLFSNGSIKFVQFASTDDVPNLLVNGTFLNVIPESEKKVIEKEVLGKITSLPEVNSVYPLGSDFRYIINLKDLKDRNLSSREVVDELDRVLQYEYGENGGDQKRKFFDLQIQELQTGGASNYQTSIAIQNEDFGKLKKASLNVSELLKNQACVENNKVKLNENCSEDNKLIKAIDDGYSYKENILYEVNLDRELLIQNKLAQLGGAPVSIAVNRMLVSKFNIDQSKPVTNLKIDGNDVGVILKPDENSKINSKENLEKSLKIGNSQVGTITESQPAQAIQRQSGKTTNLVNIRFKDKFATNQGYVSELNNLVNEYYNQKDDGVESKDLGMQKGEIAPFRDGQSADAANAFSQLGIALILAIILSYIVLALFFNSLLQPLSILYTIPITFIGVFPALAFFVNGQFGFLEIIGLIILVGIVENVAIFLIDGANQMVADEKADKKTAIAYSSGVRLKPVFMTKFTTFASLVPLAILSEFYRSISTVILGGLIVSGFISLITTPILYIFFDWLSNKFKSADWKMKLLFILFSPFVIIYWSAKP
jgi:hydrophobic/amphiphilic exporter-1 (mainly G- bacteria), HAE1 family